MEREVLGRFKDVPLGEVVEMQSEASAPRGMKQRMAVAASSRGKGGRSTESKRRGKKAPVEVSAKEGAGGALKLPERGGNKQGRDPRFDPMAREGEREARERYSFVYDEAMPAERERVKKQLKKERKAEKRGELQRHLNRLQQQLDKEQERRQKEREEQARRQREKELVKKGKKPFYPKRSQVREEHLRRKFRQLKRERRLSKFLQRRRRRLQAREKPLLPASRRAE